MQHAADTCPARIANECGGIIIRVSGVDDDGTIVSCGEFELHREGAALQVAGRVVVVVVQAALADRDGA